jgi:glycosyltransferase involved in cell wall biosynthesis
MLLTAAVCTFNRYETLRDTIASLCDQSLDTAAYQILVLDNSPDAARAHKFAATFDGVTNLRFIYVDQPGCSHARNVAIRESATPYVAFIDDDALAHRDWLINIARFFDKADPAIAAVGGQVDPLWEMPRPRWLHDKLLPYFSILDLGDRPREILLPESLIGTNVAYRRQTLDAIGGFRTDLGLRGNVLIRNDEIELQGRLQKSGRRIAYVPEVRVQHRVPKDRLTRQWLRQRIFWQGISDLISGEGHMPAAPPHKGGLFSRETNSPRRFNRECRRIVDTMRKLNAGHRVL